jgi:hypothetical protein
MAFRTKLDFSNNRQVKQHIETTTVLSGATNFGVPFGDLPTGPNLLTSGETNNYTLVISTFSGNSAVTIYNWYDPSMALGESVLSAITPSNSATTQTIEPIFTSNTLTTIDGNTVALDYSGVSFDLTAIAMYDLGGGNYSGTVETNDVKFYSAGTLDFTGRTIWADVSGITRTDRLIVTNNPQIGYVLTCIDSEGMVAFQPSSGGSSGSTSSIWVAGTGFASAVLSGSGGVASGDYSYTEGLFNIATGLTAHAEGASTTASGDYSHAQGKGTVASGASSHAEGDSVRAFGNSSHAEGQQTSATTIASHAEGFQTLASGDQSHAEGFQTIAGGNTSHAEGFQTIASGGKASHAEGFGTIASGDTSHAEGDSSIAGGVASHAEGSNTRALGDSSHAEGFGTLAIGVASHAGGYQSVASGQYSFVHGSGSTASGLGTIVLGSGITGATDDTTYVDYLNVNRILSTAFANDIRIDANGNLTTNTSDERLKENITPLTGALGKVKALQGVTYQWKDRNAGTDAVRLGFIAQQVEGVEPLLVFTNNDENAYKGLHVDGVIPLLVEAIKELTSGTTANQFLETQTILAEDNNIDLNFQGTQETAIEGGIRVLHAKGIDLPAELVTDIEGNWITNNDFKPNSLTIPKYTPTSSSDIAGTLGNVVRDENYIYIKTSTGWKRANLESF